MTKRNVKPQVTVPDSNVRETLLSGSFMQLMVLLNGLILTIVAFIILGIFIGGLTKDEYNRVNQSSVEMVIDGMSDLEHAIRTVSTILSLTQDSKQYANHNLLSEEIRKATPNLKAFDQVLWLYETRPGIWQFNNIYKRTGNEAGENTFYIVPNQPFISELVKKKFFANEKLHAVIDFKGMKYYEESAKPKTMGRHFALVKAVEKNNSKAGIIIGVSRVGSVLGPKWLDQKAILSRMTIRDLDAERDIYDIDRSGTQGDVKSLGQAYDFTVGQSSWEVALGFSKAQRDGFLEKVPYLVLFFGLVLTAIGTLYVRGNQRQSGIQTEMNRRLEQKNFELETEVSERERLNQALRRAEKENRAVIDSVTDVIFETNTEGKIIFLNATWRKVTGFDPRQSMGHDLFSMLHPQDQEQQRQDFDLLVKSQKQTYRSFTRLRTSDGTFRSVELAVSMIRQDENKNLRVVGTFTDVEERRRAERALGEAEKKYRTIVENAAGGIYQLTPEGLYLAANPAMARILGYDSREDVVRVNANEAVYVDLHDRVKFRQELEKSGFVSNNETQAYKKDGTIIWINENARVVKDDSGNVLYYEGSIEDITHRKESELALREAKLHSDLANRAKSEFLANMSHELRTPLNAIIGFSEIIKNEVFGPVGQKAYWEYARDIYGSGKGLLTIINEILDISKIEAGDRQLNDSIVDMEKVFGTALDILMPKAEDSHIKIINQMQNLPEVIGEATALKQIVINLLSNAIKFTPGGGSVTLSSDIDGHGRLRISITDTGIGLDEDEIEKALSPFGQIDNALDREGSGTGLGLTLVNSLLALHDGKLELFSEKGLGTTATIVFPAERVPQKSGKKAETSEAGALPTEDA